MAAIPSSRVSKKWSSGEGGLKVALYEIENVDTADTIDLSNEFNEISEATGITTGLAGIVVGGTTVAAVTLTLATMADDNVFLLVKGQAA